MNKKLLALCAILLIAAFLRFYKLDSIPNGLQQDETSIGYNAYSILQTGKDEHGVSYPQNFKAFGEYKLPGYIYLSVLPVALWGPTAFSIRFISAISGTLSILFIFLLATLLVENESKKLGKYSSLFPYVCAILLAINPWNIHFSRGAFETNTAAMFIASGTYGFLMAMKKKRFIFFLFWIICYAAAIYTYNIARLFVPIFSAFLIYLYRSELRQAMSTYKKYLLIIISLIVLTPFILGLFSTGGIQSSKGTLITSSAAVQSQLLEIRSYFASSPHVLTVLFFNKYLLTFWFYITNLFNYLNIDFFFIHGPTHGNHGVGIVGLWYLFELVTILAGSVLLCMSDKKIRSVIFGWIVLTVIIASLTREAPQATRSYFINLPITLLSAYGLVFMYHFMQLIKNRFIKCTSIIVLHSTMFYCIIFYAFVYTSRFPISHAKSWRTADRDVSFFLKNHEKEYNTIIIDSSSGFIYTSLLYYLAYTPADFHGASWTENDTEGFSYPIRFGKYEFKTIDWSLDLNRPNALLITSFGKQPADAKIIATFKYPQRPVVLSMKEQIMNFPVEDGAYTLIQSK